MIITMSFKEITRTTRLISYRLLSCTKSNAAPRCLPTVTLYTNKTCSLCEEAKENLVPFNKRFRLEEVNINDPKNKDWFEKYHEDIPVFHFEGKYLMKHRVNLKDFESALIQFERSSQHNG